MKIEIPTQCPSCNATLERVNDQLFCKNTNCSAQSNKRVMGFIKAMKIKGLGEKTVEKLGISSIRDIYTLDPSYMEEVLGEKITEKLLAEIDKSKTATVSMFLAGMGIPLVGVSTAKKILTTNLEILTLESIMACGIGKKAASNLVKWINTEYKSTYKHLPINLTLDDVDTKALDLGYVVCITGKVPGYTKAKIAEELTNKGVKVVGSVTKNTTHLICNERKGTLKEKKAESLNIPIVTFEEFKENL